jgi:hypothetical protein
MLYMSVPRRASSEEEKLVEVISSETNCPSASPTITSRRSHLAGGAIASYTSPPFLDLDANVAVRVSEIANDLRLYKLAFPKTYLQYQWSA